MAAQKIKGKKHGNGANTKRTEKRRARRRSRVLDRISALNKLEQSEGLSIAQVRQRTKLEAYIDHPRKRAGKYRHARQADTRNKWAAMRRDLNGAFGKHENEVSRQQMEYAR